jgi:hypothetical protein
VALDIIISTALAVLTILMAYLGVHVTLHPAHSPQKKKRYTYGFGCCAIVAVGLVLWQGIRNGSTQAALQTQLGIIAEYTKPKAVIHIDSPHWGAPSPAPPNPLTNGVRYSMNIYFTNRGNSDANETKRLAAMYIGKPDDRETQEALTDQFNREWNQTPEIVPNFSIIPNDQPYWTIYREFTVQEAHQMAAGDTIYLLVRIWYSDATGSWGTDRCLDFQKDENGLAIYVTHKCPITTDDRYSTEHK